MRLTYTDLKKEFLDNVGYPNSTDANLLNFFKRHLSIRYQQALGFLQNYTTKPLPFFAQTANNKQYYYMPPALSRVETITVKVGSVRYPVRIIDSQLEWEKLNATQTTSSIPEFALVRRNDFGLYPIPNGTYEITLVGYTRHKDLVHEDYTTGTVTTAQNSTTVTGSGTAWTSAMAGRWFRVLPDGQWYRIATIASGTSLALETFFEEVGVAGSAYVIGETPELPEETHYLLSAGVVADYYAGPRKDIAEASRWNNVFWTGDPLNTSRDIENCLGGILGAAKKYASSSDNKFVYRNKEEFDKIWATTIS